MLVVVHSVGRLLDAHADKRAEPPARAAAEWRRVDTRRASVAHHVPARRRQVRSLRPWQRPLPLSRVRHGRAAVPRPRLQLRDERPGSGCTLLP
eukprot:COSAG03_NODE_409_length_8150_cov_60.438703_3_plen_94_part_00